MLRAIKEICKVRDILATEDDNQISNPRYSDASGLYDRLANTIRAALTKKAFNKDYDIDFTAQDLRELASDIKKTFERWNKVTNPKKNIETLLKNIDNKGTVDLNSYKDIVIPVMTARVTCSRYLISLLNIAEYMAVFLYMLELAYVDEFAINYTERIEVVDKV